MQSNEFSAVCVDMPRATMKKQSRSRNAIRG